RAMIKDVLNATGITATAGIGTNLYLCKIAMDIVAKHVKPDKNGVRIAALDEEKYKKILWGHRPLTSFWRIGSGISKKLEANGMYTMGDIARMSLLRCYYDPNSYREDYQVPVGGISGEDFLFRLFGIDAELLIDHAWGMEPTMMSDIKNYKPDTNSISSGQVLGCSYPKEKGGLVLREMVDAMVLDLVRKKLVTDQVVLDIGYDKTIPTRYQGQTHQDRYGRMTPKPAHGSVRLGTHSSSTRKIMEAAVKLYQEITDEKLLVHRLTVTLAKVVEEEEARKNSFEQMDLFDYLAEQEDPGAKERKKQNLEKERRIQEAMLNIKQKYGKNAVLKGINLEEGATMKERNQQIGGHKA
ncbi:MAG: DNA methylase, partial [Lachnospiraceae bacterium]|nr:DNA methylase [Lachnospiraceae bacterium]